MHPRFVYSRRACHGQIRDVKRSAEYVKGCVIACGCSFFFVLFLVLFFEKESLVAVKVLHFFRPSENLKFVSTPNYLSDNPNFCEGEPKVFSPGVDLRLNLRSLFFPPPHLFFPLLSSVFCVHYAFHSTAF